jgi:hypothetical protein
LLGNRKRTVPVSVVVNVVEARKVTTDSEPVAATDGARRQNARANPQNHNRPSQPHTSRVHVRVGAPPAKASSPSMRRDHNERAEPSSYSLAQDRARSERSIATHRPRADSDAQRAVRSKRRRIPSLLWGCDVRLRHAARPGAERGPSRSSHVHVARSRAFDQAEGHQRERLQDPVEGRPNHFGGLPWRPSRLKRSRGRGRRLLRDLPEPDFYCLSWLSGTMSSCRTGSKAGKSAAVKGTEGQQGKERSGTGAFDARGPELGQERGSRRLGGRATSRSESSPDEPFFPMKRRSRLLSITWAGAWALALLVQSGRHAGSWDFLLVPLFVAATWWVTAGIGIRLGCIHLSSSAPSAVSQASSIRPQRLRRPARSIRTEPCNAQQARVACGCNGSVRCDRDGALQPVAPPRRQRSRAGPQQQLEVTAGLILLTLPHIIAVMGYRGSPWLLNVTGAIGILLPSVAVCRFSWSCTAIPSPERVEPNKVARM